MLEWLLSKMRKAGIWIPRTYSLSLRGVSWPLADSIDGRAHGCRFVKLDVSQISRMTTMAHG
jgi:hypothetical protein